MVAKNKFDLRAQVDEWKKSIVNSENFGTKDLDVLEAHLMTTMNNKELAELSIQERFWIAQHRLGTNQLLDRGFLPKGNLTFEKSSWFVQAIFDFLMIKAFSVIFITLTNYAYTVLNFQSIPTYLLISFFGQLLAVGLAFLNFKALRRVRVISRSYIKSNLLAFIGLIIPYGIYLLVLMRLPESRTLGFPLMTTLLSFILPLALFLLLIFMNIKEWKRYQT